MAKFAVYYVPPAESPLYRRGSEILGYDVRAGTLLAEANATRAALPEFSSDWVSLSQSYGFHVTTGYSLYFDPAVLPQIETEMENICRCFGDDAKFELIPHPEGWIAFWGENRDIVVLRCLPNPAMLMLHTMLTARINPFGTGSNISRTYEARNYENVDPVLAQRVRQYYTPYMLDGWAPHFTLLMPYKGNQQERLQSALLELFCADPIPIKSICLLFRQDHETHYRLHREYSLEVSSSRS